MTEQLIEADQLGDEALDRPSVPASPGMCFSGPSRIGDEALDRPGFAANCMGICRSR